MPQAGTPICVTPYLKLTASSTTLADEKSSCNCCVCAQSMPLFPMPAGLIGGGKNCQKHTAGAPGSEEKYINLICFISYSFSVCSNIEEVVLQEVANDGSKCSRFGMWAHAHGKGRNLSKHRALLAANDIFQDFLGPWVREATDSCSIFAMDSRCLYRRLTHFYL